MIPIYNFVALWLACIFTGGSVAMLYSLITMWRLVKRRQSSRAPFSGLDVEMLAKPVRKLVLDALAFRARKPAALWTPLAGAILSFALAYSPYQHAFHPGLHAQLPTALMRWPMLLLTMGVGFCLIPAVATAFVEAACRKAKKGITKRREAMTG